METERKVFVLIPESEWQEINRKLDEIKSLIANRNADELNSEWIESSEARKMLGISKATWQLYRDQRRIAFSQLGRKIFVKRSDLESFMKEHYIKPIDD